MSSVSGTSNCTGVRDLLPNSMLVIYADKDATSADNAQVSRKLSKAATKRGPCNIVSPELIDDLKVPEC